MRKLPKGITYTYEQQREKGTEEIFKTVITENFLPINIRHQTTDPGNSTNIKSIKALPAPKILQHIIFKLHKIKDKILKKIRGKKNTIHTQKKKKKGITSNSQKPYKQKKRTE